DKALDWGLVNRVSADSDLMADAMAMATRLADGPMSLGLIRKAYWASWENDFNKQLQLESELQSQAQQSADSSEGVAAFLQKRPADFKGQ
ncbi:MAG: 2-(1,2-epoxy-1,2-dihydrophenyl)acetyl-CoA isomerase, partial [Gammaproteobacteria bacterium]|nr:2-(1,2-epoxy-1,2-dihydrophenyl)acetyl-CoA isomerase [Gammaproteobacteria bacterium]